MVRAMGAAGRHHVTSSFIWENRIAELADRYRSLVGGYAPTSGDGASGSVRLSEVMT
jgi:hypothetical protein